MNPPKKFIDLNPAEWRSQKRSAHEPVFGPGLPSAVAYAVGWIVMFSVIYWAIH